MNLFFAGFSAGVIFGTFAFMIYDMYKKRLEEMQNDDN